MTFHGNGEQFFECKKHSTDLTSDFVKTSSTFQNKKKICLSRLLNIQCFFLSLLYFSPYYEESKRCF